jgi:hypothetical protein
LEAKSATFFGARMLIFLTMETIQIAIPGVRIRDRDFSKSTTKLEERKYELTIGGMARLGHCRERTRVFGHVNEVT